MSADDAGENRLNRCATFVAVEPGQRHGAVQHQTHVLPSSRIAFQAGQSKTPVFMARARCRMRATASKACRASGPEVLGTNRATALPRRVMITSFPASTQSSSMPSLFFASNAPTSRMMIFSTI